MEFFISFVLVVKVVQQQVANMLLLCSATARTVHKSKYWLHGMAYSFAIFKWISWSVRQDWNFRFNSMINTFNGLGYCIAIVSTSLATLRSCQCVCVCFFHNISYHISRRRFVRRRHKLQTIKKGRFTSAEQRAEHLNAVGLVRRTFIMCIASKSQIKIQRIHLNIEHEIYESYLPSSYWIAAIVTRRLKNGNCRLSLGHHTRFLSTTENAQLIRLCRLTRGDGRDTHIWLLL